MICFNNRLFYDGCELKVDDFTKYPCGVGTVEFVAYVKDGVITILNKSVKISTNPNSCSYSYKPEVDGRYIYYKIALPIFDSFDSDADSIEIPKGYFIGVLGCEKIICFNEKNSVSLSNNGDELAVTRVNDLKPMLESEFIVDFYMEEFFSICNLNGCVAKLQKKYLLEHADDCGSTKCKKGSDPDKANRDFLFIASYLLDHYIAMKDFDQADDLLKTIQTCSNSLCNDGANSSCGCNG